MSKAREFDNILDECLERVLVRGETVEQCLAGYPRYARELEPLLRTAMVTREAASIKPRQKFREAASHQFQAALREIEAKRSRGLFGWHPQWVTAAIVVVALLVTSSGTVAAAINSMPDEALYPVKLATESVQLTLTPSPEGKAELYVKLADKRVAEIIKMADEGKAEQVEKTTQRLGNYLSAVSSLALPDGGGVSATGIEAPEAPQAQLTVPAPAAPAPAPSLTPAPVPAPAPPPLRQVPPPGAAQEAPPPVVKQAPSTAAPEAPGPPQSVAKSRSSDKEKSAKAEKQAKLREDISQQATKNEEALRAVLERAPESVKPALRQAIEVAGAGYAKALGHLD